MFAFFGHIKKEGQRAGAHKKNQIDAAIDKYKTPNMLVVEHVPRTEYAGLLKVCDVLVGNSSSGIIESSLFGIPVVNIGRRQDKRMYSSNVLNSEHNAKKIAEKIIIALSPDFQKKAKNAVSVYGDGRSAKRIVDILENITIDDKLIVKQMAY